jgi:hypothetical protein
VMFGTSVITMALVPQARVRAAADGRYPRLSRTPVTRATASAVNRCPWPLKI